MNTSNGLSDILQRYLGRSSSLKPVKVILNNAERTSADVIKDIEMMQFSWIMCVSFKCNHKRSYKRDAERAFVQVIMWWLKEDGEPDDALIWASEPDFGHLPSKIVIVPLCCFKALSSGYFIAAVGN